MGCFRHVSFHFQQSHLIIKTSLVNATVEEILLLMLRSRNLVIVMEGKTIDFAFTAQPNMLKDWGMGVGQPGPRALYNWAYNWVDKRCLTSNNVLNALKPHKRHKTLIRKNWYINKRMRDISHNAICTIKINIMQKCYCQGWL